MKTLAIIFLLAFSTPALAWQGSAWDRMFNGAWEAFLAQEPLQTKSLPNNGNEFGRQKPGKAVKTVPTGLTPAGDLSSGPIGEDGGGKTTTDRN